MPKTRFLPMFPLRLVVFPKEKLNLHIFEPRYKQLIIECAKDGITFGITAYIDGKLMDIGTEMRLKSIEKTYENGEMDVVTEGVGIFKIVDFYNQAIGKMYGAADVTDMVINFDGSQFLKNETIIELAQELFGLLNIQKELNTNAETLRCFEVAHYVGFTIEQEYEFLCLRDEAERQNYMIAHLQRILPIVREMEQLRQRALLNGHFKNIIPPQL
jgi:Lon protease-like protein